MGYYTSIRTNTRKKIWSYSHTMIFIKPFLIVFRGITGTLPINDSWILNVKKASYYWINY